MPTTTIPLATISPTTIPPVATRQRQRKVSLPEETAGGNSVERDLVVGGSSKGEFLNLHF